MKVWCAEHAQQLGEVRLHGDVVTRFVTLSSRWKVHNAEVAWAKGAISAGERANSSTNLRDWTGTRTEVEAKGCEDCGPRMLDVAVLLQAFDEGRDKISL